MSKSRLVDRIGAFTVIPNTIIRIIPSIGPEALTLFVYLRYRTNSHTETTFPTYQTIKNDTGLHFRKIARALRALERAGIVVRKKRFGKSTIYTIKLPDVGAAGEEHDADSPSTIGRTEEDASPSTTGSISPSTTGSISPSTCMQTNKIDLNKIDLDKNRIAARSGAANPDLYQSAIALATVCQMPFEKNKGQLFAEAKRLGENADDILAHYGRGCWWYKTDWRGRMGQPPTPAQIRSTWGRWNENDNRSPEYTEDDRAVAAIINGSSGA